MKNNTLSLFYVIILCFVILLFGGIQLVYCSEGQLTLRSKNHPEWLDQAVIIIDSTEYTYDTLTQKISAGYHSLECRYKNMIFQKSVFIQPKQNNIIYVKFKEEQGTALGMLFLKENLFYRKLESARITIDNINYDYSQFPLSLDPGKHTLLCLYEDNYLFEKTFMIISKEKKSIKVKWQRISSGYNIKPGEEGRTRPGTVSVSIDPPSVQDSVILWVQSSDEAAPIPCETRRLILLPGEYQIYANAKGYEENITKVTVPSGGDVNFKIYLKESSHGILKIYISPKNMAKVAKIYLKNLKTGEEKQLKYDERGYKVLKGEYQVYASAWKYDDSTVEEVSVLSKERIINVRLVLNPWIKVVP